MNGMHSRLPAECKYTNCMFMPRDQTQFFTRAPPVQLTKTFQSPSFRLYTGVTYAVLSYFFYHEIGDRVSLIWMTRERQVTVPNQLSCANEAASEFNDNAERETQMMRRKMSKC